MPITRKTFDEGIADYLETYPLSTRGVDEQTLTKSLDSYFRRLSFEGDDEDFKRAIEEIVRKQQKQTEFPVFSVFAKALVDARYRRQERGKAGNNKITLDSATRYSGTYCKVISKSILFQLRNNLSSKTLGKRGFDEWRRKVKEEARELEALVSDGELKEREAIERAQEFFAWLAKDIKSGVVA